MRKILLISALLCAACCISPGTSYAEYVSSTDLIDNAKALNGKRILYKGEVVTAILGRGEYSWVSLSDGPNAVSAWCRSSALKEVRFIGGYGSEGDIIEVEGIFHRACPAHGGELDIHAENLKIANVGHILKDEIDDTKISLAIAVFLATILLIVIFRRRF